LALMVEALCLTTSLKHRLPKTIPWRLASKQGNYMYTRTMFMRCCHHGKTTSPRSFDERRTAPGGRPPSDQANQLGPWVPCRLL